MFMTFSCMFEQCLSSVLDKTNKWHLTNHIWSLNLNLVFKPTSFKSMLVALAQITAYCHIMIMHHIVALHWLCSFFVAGGCSPSVDVCSDDEFDDTDEELYYLQKCQASKTPLFIPIQSYSVASVLFYCIRTTTIYLLHAAVAEPLFLCMNSHCHSK